MTHDFVSHLLAVSLSHSHRQFGPGGKVPPQFMVGAMSIAQTAFARLLQAELEDLQQAFEATLAWNKLLLVHLNVLLLGYFLPPHAGTGSRPKTRSIACRNRSTRSSASPRRVASPSAPRTPLGCSR